MKPELFLLSDKSGSVISRTIDFLIETNDRYWIIDNKSNETENRDERFDRYRPYHQYTFDVCVRAQLGQDDEMSKDVMHRIWEVLQKTHRLRSLK